MKLSSDLSNIPLKIVVDTNLYLSLFVFRSTMLHHIFELVTDEKLTLYLSPAQITEIKKKFEFFEVKQQVQEKAMLFVDSRGILVEPTITIEKSRDIKDNFLLELSETAYADYLVTRDNDLLVLEKWKETKIITPEDFLPLLREMKIL